jgi:hypothetical protein
MSLPFSLALLFGFPPLFFCLVAVLVLVAGGGEAFANVFSVPVIFAGTIFITSCSVYYFTSSVRALGPRFKTLGYGRYFLAVFCGSIVLAIPIMLMNAFVYSRYNPNPWKAIIFIVAIVLGFLYNLVALRQWLDDSPQERKGAGFLGAISVGSIFLVCLLAMTGNWVLIPEGIAYLYGIGNIEGATLLLDKEGCSTAQGLGVRKKPEVNEGCRLDNVKILNRLGTTYYIKTPEGIAFTLPSSSVKSHEVQASVLLEVNVEQVGDAAGGGTKVTLTNSYHDEIDNISVRVELLDEDGHLRQSRSVEVGKIPPGQQEEITLDLPLPSYSGQRNYYVFLSRRGKELSYKRKWQ